MNRLEKKCLVASMSLHAFLLCVALFGSAFFVSSKKAPPEYTRMRVVPTRLVDDAFSGGGGNPNLKPSDAQQKGNPDATAQPQPPPPVAKRVEQPPPPAPKPKEPTPQPKPVAPKKAAPPPKEVKQPDRKPPEKDRFEDILSQLKPAKLNDSNKAREKAAAEARARDQREWNQKIAKQIGRTVEGLAQGFEQGTVVEASGPGGEAYANYADFVRQKYEDAWVVSDMMTDEESTVRVTIVIHQSGRVVNARIARRSGNAELDRTVQKALDKVRFIAPFPEGSRDEQRTFTINFNLKTKRLLG